MIEVSLLSKPEIFLKISFAETGLTHITNDLGPENTTWPKPVYLVPKSGLWVVDPGQNLASWRLIHFDLNGQIVYSQNLVDKLNLSAPSEFIPIKLSVNLEKKSWLLASLYFDFDKQIQKNYVLISFSSTGELISTLNLSDEFQFDGRAYIINGGYVLNFEKKGPIASWYKYDTDTNRSKLFDVLPSSESVALSHLVLERVNGTFFRILNGHSSHSLALKNDRSDAEEPVDGIGSFFGFIKRAPESPLKSKEGVYEQIRNIEILFFDNTIPLVYNLGIETLMSSSYSESNNNDFVVFQTEQSIFDESGNLYEIEWTPISIIVYRYVLNSSQFNKILKSLK